jgi:hypothetical protein
MHHHARSPNSSTPEALAPVRVLLSRSIYAYSASSVPLAGTSGFHRCAVYTQCLRCAGAPRRPASGSVLSLVLCLDMSSSQTPGSSAAALIQFFAANNGLHSRGIIRHFQVLHHPLPVGIHFVATLVRLRYDLSSCLSSWRIRLGSRQAYEDFYFRASDGLVARPVTGYHYSGNWIISTGGTCTR